MKIRTVIILTLAAGLAYSCSAAMDGYLSYDYEDGPSISNNEEMTAIVTVKKAPTDTVFFQLNDSTRLYPVNYQASYTRMERIVCSLNGTGAKNAKYGSHVFVNWADSIDEGVFTVETPEGEDNGMDIYDDWMTSVEDGYLTLHYSIPWGRTGIRHSFYVVGEPTPDGPYTLQLRHHANGDTAGAKDDALVCFDINSLPDTKGDYKTLTLKWTTCGGVAAEKKFKFKTRE